MSIASSFTMHQVFLVLKRNAWLIVFIYLFFCTTLLFYLVLAQFFVLPC